MNNIDELISRLKFRVKQLEGPGYLMPNCVADLKDAITALREQQERIAELEHKEQHYLMMLEESGIDSSAAKQAECVFEQPFYLAERQRDAALEALEELAKSPTPAGKYWKDFASDALRRIRGMK